MLEVVMGGPAGFQWCSVPRFSFTAEGSVMPVFPSHREFVAAAEVAMRRYPVVHVDVSWEVLFGMIAGLQLALRHSAFPPHSGGLLRGFLDGMIAQIGAVSPVVAQVMAAGFDPSNDVELWEVPGVDEISVDVPH